MAARLVNRRIRLLIAVFAVGFSVALVRAAWLQAIDGRALGRLATSQHRQTVTTPASRGTIYDRRGIELAIGERAVTVYANPRQIRDPRHVADVVAETLRIDPMKVLETIGDRSQGFVYVAR